VIILDTDVLSVVQRGDSPEYDRLAERLDTADEEVAVTIISIEEQMRGWLAFIARAKSSFQQVKAYAKLLQRSRSRLKSAIHALVPADSSVQFLELTSNDS
jgi:predicted nucleic acid-binding protein